MESKGKTRPARIMNTIQFEEHPTQGTDRETVIKNARDAMDKINAIQRRKITTDKELADDLARLAEIGEKVGKYVIAPPEPITSAAVSYQMQNVERVEKALRDGGASENTIQAVTGDYARALLGITPLKATAEQMADALKAIPPTRAFNTDRFVLYLSVLRPYNLILRSIDAYNIYVKQEPDAEKRQRFFNDILTDAPAVNAVAFDWLRNNGCITVSDFAGVEQSAISRFLALLDATADIGVYLTYYCVAKFALRATTEHLQQIRPPRCFKSEADAFNYAEQVAAEFIELFDDLAATISQLIEDAATHSPATAETAETIQRQLIKIPEHYALIMSRQLWATNAQRDGEKVNSILPISSVINDFLARNPQSQQVTPLIIQKAIEGVNILRQIKGVEPTNGQYTFETNLTEFSNICGYADANDEEKKQLLTALLVIDGVFLVVWKNGGQYAQRILTVERFGLTSETAYKLRFHVFASAIKGRPKFISRYELMAMREKEKGEAKRHFRGQILAKGHKREETLLDEVFEYSDKIREAEQTEDAEQVAAAKEYKRKTLNRNRNKLIRWFEDWAKRGIIEYTREQNAEGKTVWSWRRLQPPTDEEIRAYQQQQSKLNQPENN